MKEPVRIFSDLHLGHPGSRLQRVERFRPLLKGAGTVIFNGDTWQEMKKSLREEARGQLLQLQAMCREEQVEAVFLPGNHDPGWQEPSAVELAGGHVVVTHGDMLYRAGAPWKREVIHAEARVEAIWNQYPLAAQDIHQRALVAQAVARESTTRGAGMVRAVLWRRVWDALTPPKRAWRILKAWWQQATAGVEFLDQYFPNSKILLIGHFHHAGWWRRCGKIVVNTGSFMSPGSAYWAEWSQGVLTWGRIEERPDACQLGRARKRWQP